MRSSFSRSSPVKSEKKRRFFSRIIWFFSFALILFILLGILSHLPKLMINNIEITGAEALDVNLMREEALEYLSENSALIYARGNIFLFSKKRLTNLLKKEFPRIFEIAKIERQKQLLVVDILERHASYIWCGNTSPSFVEQFKNKDCFFVDQTGFVFDTSPFFTNGVYLTIYGGIDSETNPINQNIVTKNSLTKIENFIDSLRDNNLPIHSLVLKDENQYEFLLDIYTTTDDFARIIWNEDMNLEEVEKKILLTLEEKEFNQEYKNNGSQLLYIDTRFKNRVFYKFGN